jgi:hypothetical protein
MAKGWMFSFFSIHLSGRNFSETYSTILLNDDEREENKEREGERERQGEREKEVERGRKIEKEEEIFL